MGFYIASLDTPTALEEYISSKTMHSMANHGAFDSEVSEYWNEYVEENENVMAVVDESGVEGFLDILKNTSCSGRDIAMVIEAVENKYSNGFLIIQ